MMERLDRLIERAMVMETEAGLMDTFLQAQVRLQRLQDQMVHVRKGMHTDIADDEIPGTARSRQVWVAVGPGGIPDDVSVIVENRDESVFPSVLVTTEFDAAKDAGRSSVIPGSAFLALGTRLVDGVQSGSLSLPYNVGLSPSKAQE